MKTQNRNRGVVLKYFTSATFLAVFFFGICGSALYAGSLKLTLSAGSPGGGYFKAAAAFAEYIKSDIPGTVTTVIPGGTWANVERLDGKLADIAILENTGASLAWEGIKPAKKKYNFRMLASFRGPSIQQAVVADSFKLRSFEEIKKKKYPLRLAMYERTQLSSLEVERILKVYGITFNDIRSWGGRAIYTSIQEGIRMMTDGIIEMWFSQALLPHHKFIEFGTKKRFRLIPISKEVAQKVAKERGQNIVMVPKDVYKEHNGFNEPYWSPATLVCFAVRTDLPENLVYKLTKLLADHKEEFWKIHKQHKFYNPKDAWKNIGTASLHPGAERYYKEMGYMP